MKGPVRFVSIAVASCAVLAAAIAADPARMATAATPLATIRVATGLARPLFVTHAPNDTDRVFILEQHVGRIRILKGDTLLVATPFMTQTGLSTGDEQGLLGMAFHPDYATNGEFFVSYTRGDRANVLLRYNVSMTNPDSADLSTRDTILVVAQPQTNHNGGWIGFGPDGYLYFSIGDGGGAGDDDAGHDATVGNGQSDGTRLGKMLRIDVDGGTPYAIPPTNPFVGMGSPKEEFWAKGLRNAWRPSFDRQTGDFYIADVGQNVWEEVNYQPASSAGGENYGWRKFEGYALFNCPSPCDSSGLTRPVQAYSHSGGPGCSVTGGYVYRGDAIPDLKGSYFYGDYCSNQIWTIRVVGGVVSEGPINRTADLAPGSGLSIGEITSFGENAKGELYICDRGALTAPGEVYKIIPETTSEVGSVGPAPMSLLLGEAIPNPSARGFSFRVGVPASDATRLRVYDASGRVVRTLVDGALSAGTREMRWDARDSGGRLVPGGVYFLKLDAGGAVETRRLTVVR
jgi:glucose/arabinose dehydrogenase